METIFAQSSAPGKAGVAVFRISGDQSLLALKTLTTKSDTFMPNKMYYRKIVDPMNGELIDNAMVVYFKAPASFTGEDVVEIHTHGSKAISIMLTNALLNIEGMRLAEAGEFARRAFLNNKFDLTAAEGLADLIEAETILQHRQATRQVGGALEHLYSGWRQELLTIISLLEAYIDFPDEDIHESTLQKVRDINENLKNTITRYLGDSRRGELLRSGIKLTILGPANVGKSSLLNFLMQRNVAIVSNIPGTTRDIVEGHLDIGGYPIILQDTAGIRLTSNDIIEQEGIKRAIDSAKQADIKIIMLDVAQMELEESIQELIDDRSIIIINKIDLVDMIPARTETVPTLLNEAIPTHTSVIPASPNYVIPARAGIHNTKHSNPSSQQIGPTCDNKQSINTNIHICDRSIDSRLRGNDIVRDGDDEMVERENHARVRRGNNRDTHENDARKQCDNDPLYISIKDKIGLDDLIKRIENIAYKIAGLTETPHVTRERHRHYLQQALQHLTDFNTEKDLVLATEDIRLAIRSISTITGQISVDEILGEIFSNFCIGK